MIAPHPPTGPPSYQHRRHLWLRPGEALVCPNGHKLKHNAALLQHEAFICQQKAERGQGECNARCYILMFPGGRKFVAEVTVAEMLHMRDRCMGVDEVLDYLRASAA